MTGLTPTAISIRPTSLSQLDTPLPNFHEHFITQSFQPFAEFEWHPLPKLVITAGIKAANYAMSLNQYQDNGKTVGCLGGTRPPIRLQRARSPALLPVSVARPL